MEDLEILQRVIIQLRKNGFNIFEAWIEKIYLGLTQDYYKLIFSHEFAKAFWGEEEYHPTEHIEDQFPYMKADFDRLKVCKCWEYHLQNMVLEKEPLKYLEKFLK
jgi:hypothetical protein